MTDLTPATARHRLPLMTSGQAQKEIVHNEALTLADLAINASAEAVLATPPPAPGVGDAWIVGTGAIGAWAGRDGQLAGWTEGGWRFVALPDGATVRMADGLVAERRDGDWSVGVSRVTRIEIGGDQVVGPRGAAVPVPTGGATVDGEARAALAMLIERLRTHGLIDG